MADVEPIEYSVEVDGEAVEILCEDTLASKWVTSDILRNRTYPVLPFVADVRVVFDVGANIGAATVHFARHYPDARVHAFEPGSGQRSILRRNAADHPNVVVHPIGFDDRDREVPLYRGRDDSGMSSIHSGAWTSDEHELVTIRAAGPWATENDIERIDLLKVDAEGCELGVIGSLSPLLTTVKVIYVEYDSRASRRAIDRLLEPTHDLYVGKVLLDQGECVYLSRALADTDAATDALRAIFTADR